MGSYATHVLQEDIGTNGLLSCSKSVLQTVQCPCCLMNTQTFLATSRMHALQSTQSTSNL